VNITSSSDCTTHVIRGYVRRLCCTGARGVLAAAAFGVVPALAAAAGAGEEAGCSFEYVSGPAKQKDDQRNDENESEDAAADIHFKLRLDWTTN